MNNPTRKYLRNQIASQKVALQNLSAIKLNSILGSENYLNIIGQCKVYRERIFTPFVTLMTFVKQVLDPDKSCKKAVGKIIAERLSRAQKPCSQNSGPYCNARKRFPESTIHELVTTVGKETDKRTPSPWKWKGCNVHIVDGTTLLMADTKENQADYPQHANQREGIGFPILRLVVIFSLATGVVLNYAMDTIRGLGTGEPSLLRRIINNVLWTGDILLGDCCFHSYFLMVELIERGCDGLFQAHAQFKFNLRQGKKIGKNDYIITWKRTQRPDWMDVDTFKKYPKTIKVRICKVGKKFYITTLLNHKKTPKGEIGDLYRVRWQAELHLRSIKTIMGMDMLSCKSPQMVRKEIGVHLLAYNIIRIMMAESGVVYGIPPLQISFKNAVQFINSFMPYLALLDVNIAMVMYEHMLHVIAEARVAKRPGRQEPRVLKRRPNQYPMLNRHRNTYQRKLNGPILALA